MCIMTYVRNLSHMLSYFYSSIITHLIKCVLFSKTIRSSQDKLTTIFEKILIWKSFLFIFSDQVCVPSPSFRRIPGMNYWCQTNCLRYPPNCPETVCTCPWVYFFLNSFKKINFDSNQFHYFNFQSNVWSYRRYRRTRWCRCLLPWQMYKL